jgi:DNA-directed RNA polymerase specialized sigma24 family protein
MTSTDRDDRGDGPRRCVATSSTEPSASSHSGRSDPCEYRTERLPGSPEAVLGILRSAHSTLPDPRLGAVLDHFRSRWLALGRRRYPGLGSGIEDAAQTALMRLISRGKLDTLRRAERLEAWARSLFVHAVLDLVRDPWRPGGRRIYDGPSGDDGEHAFLDGLPDDKPTPEELVAFRERLAIVARVVSRLEVARLKFIEDLPEKEIALRRGVSRSCVAGRLKRVRSALRQSFKDDE